MTVYVFGKVRIALSEIGGAVAEAILHDLRVNHLPFNGFPEILVEKKVGDNRDFVVKLRADDFLVEFVLSLAEARQAAELMKERETYDPAIFDRIQEAVAKLEGLFMNGR
ncbi:hypothetical protein [Roseibium sp. SCP14]|uniref:hypothetical protein n=1 Tax=Roseibium sp. SCP14 TaxID=3141375 RepID=UPI00333C2F41